MASTHPRKASSKQQISLILPDDKRVTRSLHTSDPQEASQIAEKTQTLVNALTGKEKARQTVLRVLVEDIFIAAKVPNPWEVRDISQITPWFSKFAQQYIERKTCAQATKDFIEAVCVNFMASLPTGALIGSITGLDCQRWYDQMSRGISYGTAKNRLAAVSSVFTQAVKLKVIQANPCDHLQTKPPTESDREEFTDEEVEKIENYLWDKGLDEWLTAVKLSRWAGLRLVDAVFLSKVNILKAADGSLSIKYTPKKTERHGKVVVVPCCQILTTRLVRLLSLDGEYLCPKLRTMTKNTLSNAFGEILDAAGIDCGKHEVNGRMLRKKSFHSLRHSCGSWLARLGMPEEQRMLILGHATKSAHKTYIHRSPEDVLALTSKFINPPSTPV